jgi:peroxidase
MRKNMCILRFLQIPGKSHQISRPASLTKLEKPLKNPRFFLGTVSCLLSFAVLSATAADLRGRGSPSVSLLREFRPIGGTGNNLHGPNPLPGTPELALAPLNFARGTRDGLVNGPNARIISNVISGGTGAKGQNGQTTDTVVSAWLYVFGQFLDHDIDLEETPLTSAPINISVLPGDPLYPKVTSIAMTRDTRSPVTNTIINTVAGYLDLSQLYGSTVPIAASLRNPDGTLKSSDNGLALPVVNDTFVTGDPRVMENPELTVLTILFMREHNFWVKTLKAQNPHWTGDQLYNMAKAITTAEYQNIVYTEFLPVLIGPVLGPYRGYDPTVNAQVTQEFSTAAFRVGHSQVSDTQEGIDNNENVVFTESLAQSFYNTPEIDEANGIDPLIRSLGTDFTQATDVYAVAALRDLLNAGLVGGGKDLIDLMAIDIQRERDVGLATLNQTRAALGLSRYTSIEQLTPDPVLQKSFQIVYGPGLGGLNNIDLFMGGLAETHAPRAQVGPTFQAIIARQFSALRAGDRFFWLNQGFDRNTAAMISSTTLTDVIQRNTDTPNLQANVFIQSSLPTHTKPHAVTPSVVDTHGRALSPFIKNGN